MSSITVCFTYSLRMAIFEFLNTDISQESVATRLGCGGVFIYHFVTNFLLSLTVKEFWKSVNIWWSYGQELGVLFFFDSQCRIVFMQMCVLLYYWANKMMMMMMIQCLRCAVLHQQHGVRYVRRQFQEVGESSPADVHPVAHYHYVQVCRQPVAASHLLPHLPGQTSSKMPL